jgi:hypothetical protein
VGNYRNLTATTHSPGSRWQLTFKQLCGNDGSLAQTTTRSRSGTQRQPTVDRQRTNTHTIYTNCELDQVNPIIHPKPNTHGGYTESNVGCTRVVSSTYTSTVAVVAFPHSQRGNRHKKYTANTTTHFIANPACCSSFQMDMPAVNSSARTTPTADT